MSEQQADYDTNNTQPTPGPWRLPEAGDFLVFQNRGLIIAELDEFDEPVVVGEVNEVFNKDTDLPGHYEANARLIAAAGTAASLLPDGWNAIDVLQALPKLLRAADMAVDSTLFRDEDGHAYPPDRSQMVDLRNALNAARKDTTQTDE